jgi:hypothetical protein
MSESLNPKTGKKARPRGSRKTVHKNPPERDHATEAAIAKALEWFGEESLLTDPEDLPWTPPAAAVLVGRLVAIEYASDKWDGKERVYRHDLDRPCNLAISIDGSTIILDPPLRVTKRGLEG